MSKAPESIRDEELARPTERPPFARGRYERPPGSEHEYVANGRCWLEAFDARHGDPLAQQSEPAQEHEAA